MAFTIRFRRGARARLQDVNPKLFQGEPVYETDTGRLKIGDGESPWNDLPYFATSSSGGAADLEDHVNSPTPHPVYDDGPSLFLLYENAKV